MVRIIEGAEKYYCLVFFFAHGIGRQMEFNKFNISLEAYTAIIIVSHDSFIKKKMDFDKVHANRSPKISTKTTSSSRLPSHSFVITIYQYAERGKQTQTKPTLRHSQSQPKSRICAPALAACYART